MTYPRKIVLVIDDDDDDRLMINEALNELNPDLHVGSAASGTEALALLKELQDLGKLPSLIIVDYNMPVMDGKETMNQIRQIPAFKDIPIVIYTTSRSEQTRKVAEMLNTDMVSKAATLNEVKQQVARMLEYAKM